MTNKSQTLFPIALAFPRQNQYLHAPSRLWHRCGRGRYVRAVVVLLNMIEPHQSDHRAASYANSTFSLPIRNRLVFLYPVLENPLSSLSSHITSLTPCFQRRTLPPRGRRRPAGTSEGTPSPASASVGARLPADRIGRERKRAAWVNENHTPTYCTLTPTNCTALLPSSFLGGRRPGRHKRNTSAVGPPQNKPMKHATSSWGGQHASRLQ